MKRNSEHIPIIIGVTILCCVALGLSGIAYSFYRSEVTQQQEEATDLANDDSPFEQLKREKNIVITPVPEEFDGSTGIDNSSEGIPTGTYSNPPTSINPTSSTEPILESRPLNNQTDFNSTTKNFSPQESLTESLSESSIDYSGPASSNNFNSSNDNSLLDSLEEDTSLLETPSSTVTQPPETATPSLTESSF